MGNSKEEVLYIQSSHATKMICILLICNRFYPIRHYAIEVNKLLAILMSSILKSPGQTFCVFFVRLRQSLTI